MDLTLEVTDEWTDLEIEDSFIGELKLVEFDGLEIKGTNTTLYMKITYDVFVRDAILDKAETETEQSIVVKASTGKKSCSEEVQKLLTRSMMPQFRLEGPGRAKLTICMTPIEASAEDESAEKDETLP